MQNNEATQQFPGYVMPEAAKGVPISEALPGGFQLEFFKLYKPGYKLNDK